MPEKRYLLDLDEEQKVDDYIRVWIRTERGTVVDFVAQYEAIVQDRIYPVARYDGSHGRGHRDLLDRHGETIRKT